MRTEPRSWVGNVRFALTGACLLASNELLASAKGMWRDFQGCRGWWCLAMIGRAWRCAALADAGGLEAGESAAVVEGAQRAEGSKKRLTDANSVRRGENRKG